MPLDLDWLRSLLPGRELYWFASIDTTMREAARLAASGAPSGTVVAAEEQTAGQGRYGRAWYSEPESGLYLSVLLRVPVPLDSFPILTLTVGLAARQAIERSTGLLCDLRWPNDVLLGGRKCAGILMNLEADAAVAGIGINVNHTTFPEEIAPLATSLRLAAGRPFRREALLVDLLESIDAHCDLLAGQGADAILAAFTQASSYARGRRIVVEQDEGFVEGTTVGLDPRGFLRLERDTGESILILAGGIRPAEGSPSCC